MQQQGNHKVEGNWEGVYQRSACCSVLPLGNVSVFMDIVAIRYILDYCLRVEGQ